MEARPSPHRAIGDDTKLVAEENEEGVPGREAGERDEKRGRFIKLRHIRHLVSMQESRSLMLIEGMIAKRMHAHMGVHNEKLFCSLRILRFIRHSWPRDLRRFDLPPRRRDVLSGAPDSNDATCAKTVFANVRPVYDQLHG